MLSLFKRKIDDSKEIDEYRNGTYKFKFRNRLNDQFDLSDNAELTNKEISIPFSDTKLIVKGFNYSKKTGIFELFIKIENNPVATSAVLLAVAGVVGVSLLTWLVYEGAEEVIIIPALAVLGFVVFGFLSDTGITKQIGKFISGK